MNLPTKSKMAFQWSAESIPTNRHGNLYFWTFTFAEVLDVAEGRRRWSEFLRKLRKRKKRQGLDFKGLRVFELHPGGHGLHIHVLTHCFLRVNEVRALWQSCGGGRVHVLPIAADRAGYAGKYLRKSGRPDCFKGVRMWAAFGGMEHTKVKDVDIESSWTRAYQFLKATVRTVCGKTFTKLRWFERLRAVENVLCGNPWYWALPYLPTQEGGPEITVFYGNLI
jgi:hypothetical protein